jgi:threonine dehydrogenase-like Zn-dependent dehydrogenase
VIDAVGLESHGFALDNLYDYAKQTLMLETDRSSALRQAIMACRKGGRISIPGVMAAWSTSFRSAR